MTFLKGFIVFLFISTSILLLSVQEVEPNNNYNDSGVQTVINGDHTGFVASGESDYWKFWAITGDLVTINCVNNQTSFDTYLYLYDTTGVNQLASNDDALGTTQSQIQFQMSTTGYHYFDMRGFGSSSGTYMVSLSGASPNDPNLPGEPSNPSPSNGVLNLDPENITLSWDFGNNTETYDLYLGIESNPDILVQQDEIAGQSGTYSPPTLQLDTMYIWRVVAKNSISQYDREITWHFRTHVASNVIQIGSADNMQAGDMPIVTYGYSSMTQTIYTSDEMGAPGLISSIGYQYFGDNSMLNCDDWTIYVGHTNVGSFSSVSSWIPVNSLQQVFAGQVLPGTTQGWFTLDFTNPFFYNGNDNIVVCVYENTPGSSNGQNRFLKSNSTINKTLTGLTVSQPMFDPFNPVPAELVQTFYPNTRFTVNRDITGAYVLAFPFEYDWGLLDVGSTSSTETVTITNYGATTATINDQPILLGDFVDQFTLTDNNSYPVALNTFDSITLEICFNPTSGGNKHTELYLTHDWQGSTEVVIPFMGRGLVIDNNDTPSTATELQLIVEDMPCAIEPQGDIDFYSFFQVAPASVSIFTEGIDDSQVNPEIYLYGPYDSIPNNVVEAECIMVNDDQNGSLHPRIDMNFNESGFYLFRIASYDNYPGSRTSPLGEYLLTVLSTNTEPPGLLDPPMNPIAINQSDCIQLIWEAPENGLPSGYNLYRDGVRVNNDLITTLSYSDYNVGSGIEYEYYLTSFVDTFNQESIPSDTLIVTFTPGGTGYLSDNFESYDNFVLQFGNWITVDGDDENTLGFNNGIDFASEEQPMAFTVFNQSATTPPINFAPAYSANKALASFAPENGNRDDWLISEEIALNDTSAFASFYGRTVFPQYGLEQFRAYIITDYSDPNNPVMQCISGISVLDLPVDWSYFGFNLEDYLGQTIRFAVNLTTEGGFMAMLDDFRVTVQGVATEVEDYVTPAEMVTNLSNYPNPFNPTTTISYTLNEHSDVNLSIYNIRGQLVKVLKDANQKPGNHSIVWNGSDNYNQSVAGGIYFYRLKTDGFVSTKKMLMVK